MKILALSPEVPWPANQGGRIRMAAFLRNLAERHEVHLISSDIYDVMQSGAGEHPLARALASLHVVRHPQTPWRSGLRIAKSVVLGHPYVSYKHGSGELKRAFQRTARAVKPDVVLALFHYLAPIAASVDIPRVVDMQNIDTKLYERIAQKASHPLRRLHARRQMKLMERFEASIPSLFNACAVVSAEDREWLHRLARAQNVEVIPNGVDCHYFEARVQPESPFDILFIGSMDYVANVDAALCLVRQLMPLVWSSRPETTVKIVGRGPTREVLTLQKDSRVYVTGEVPDVRPYMQAAKLLALPIRIGGGSRIKIREAGAAAMAMAGTSVAFEGSELRNGVEAFITDSNEDLARGVLHLLDNVEERQTFGRAAQRRSRDFDWHRVAEQLENLLRRASA